METDLKLAVGDRGFTMTRLSPMGTARFGSSALEVKALEGMIDPDVEVEVVLLEDGKVYVRPVSEEY